MKLDVKTLIVGVVIGWYVTVSRASIAVAKQMAKENIARGEKEAE